MRALLAATAVVFLASCASTPTGDTVKVYDHKYNQFYFVKKQPTGGTPNTGDRTGESPGRKPSWYERGHP